MKRRTIANEHDLALCIDEALQRGNWKPLDAWVLHESEFAGAGPALESTNGCFARPVVSVLARTFAREDFIRSRKSELLIALLHQDWGRFSPPDRRRLLEILAVNYAGFVDRLARFRIIEMVGEFEGGTFALETLERLARAPRATVRVLVPMGLRWIARKTVDESLRQKALAEIERLRSDRSERVRVEAFLALDQIARQRSFPEH